MGCLVKYTGGLANIRAMEAPHLLEGRLGERVACRFLLRQGYDILARRYRARWGEIDLVAFDGPVLAFVEVKTRGSRAFGDPTEFVDWQKRQSLRLAAEDFIARHDMGAYSYRFDIVAVIGPGTRREEVSLHRDAF